ncbi:MAG TPA: alkaline phosphatase family protein [Thermoanaerobaculia bacterium]|nr:alkaline phosphatase family protein [Thermoanaerobaculia bacterium]
MKRFLLSLLLAASLLAAAPRKPRLVVTIVIDQFRYDYLTRLRGEFHGGFHRLLTSGAVFSNANYIHVPTVTAVGHSTILTGATPSVSGIVGNDWYDPEEHRHVTSVSDGRTSIVGGAGEGSSPHRMLVSTVGDELKMADAGRSRVIGISLKDRAAILPAGHSANAAYWFDIANGSFVTSSYYMKTLPPWVEAFNDGHPANRYRGRTWLQHTLPQDPARLYAALESSPFGNELLEQFAERAIEAEQLGKRDVPDLLCISFSANDYVGHTYGTYSPEQRQVTLEADRALDRLFASIDRAVGLDNALIVLTGDHGVAPSAADDAANHMPGGNMPGNAVREAVQAALEKAYGPGNWVVGSWDLALYLNQDLIAQKKLDPAAVNRTAAAAAFAVPHILRAYTRDQLAAGAVSGDQLSRRVENGFHVRRSADIEFIPDPYWMFSGAVATHGTPFDYDSHVPVIFMGSGIKPGRYDASVTVNDIAPTLATILEVETPSGSVGRVLTEMW